MIRVCEKGHITGTKTCWCKAKADVVLGERVRPVTLHPRDKAAIELRVVRLATRVGRSRLAYREGVVSPAGMGLGGLGIPGVY
jgi:hypothetical protein